VWWFFVGSALFAWCVDESAVDVVAAEGLLSGAVGAHAFG
jgi:hypothetical protein